MPNSFRGRPPSRPMPIYTCANPCISMLGAKRSRVQWLRAQCNRDQHFQIVISNSGLGQPLRLRTGGTEASSNRLFDCTGGTRAGQHCHLKRTGGTAAGQSSLFERTGSTGAGLSGHFERTGDAEAGRPALPSAPAAPGQARAAISSVKVTPVQ